MAFSSNNQMLSDEIASSLAPLNRRSFLKAGLGMAISSTSLLTLGCSSEAPVDIALKSLSPAQQQLFQRLIEVLLPVGKTGLTSAESVPVLANIDKLFAGLDSKVRGDLEGATVLFEYGSVLLGGHFSRFTRLNDADAVSYIDDWQNGNSIQRGVITTLKKLVYASYWRDDKTWAPVGFDGPVTVRWGIPSLGNSPLPVEQPS